MKIFFVVLALVFTATIANAQVGRQIGNPDELFAAIKDSHNMFVCVEITGDKEAPTSAVETCSRIEKISKWSLGKLGGRISITVDMDYPAVRDSRIQEIIFVDSSKVSPRTVPGWVAFIKFTKPASVGGQPKVVYDRGVRVSKFLIY